MSNKIKNANRTLSKKDDVSLEESLKIIGNFSKDARTGLIIPEDHKTDRKHHCGYCGKGYGMFEKKGKYFGEVFHAKCCEAMLRGESNE